MKPKIQYYNSDKFDETNHLWKFLTIEKFLSIILNQKFHFTRLDGFDDPLEGISDKLLLLKHTKKALMSLPPFNVLSQKHGIDLLGSETDQLNEDLRITQKFQFANCWYLSPKDIESVAMWNLYSSMNSVALCIPYNSFKDSIVNFGLSSRLAIESLTLGLVNYVNYSSSNDIQELAKDLWKVAFTKDKSYSHENEFRLIAKIPEYDEVPFTPKKGISIAYQKSFYDRTSQIFSLELVPNNFQEYPFEIVFHPKMPVWIQTDIQTILNKFKIPFNARKSNLEAE